MSEAAVLIIDDDADMRDLVGLNIEAMGFDVIKAGSCVDGIAALAANRDRIRLVLLDYFMPGMEPAACATEVRRLAGRALVVLCTAAMDARARATEVGLSRWLAKPFTLASLQRLVREAVRQSSVVDESRPSAS
jgi:DNA-binding NtrC family response regulator